MKEAEKIVKKIEKVTEVLNCIYDKLDEIYIEDDLDSTLKRND